MSWETKVLCEQAIELNLDMDPGSSTFKHHVPSSKLLKVQIILSICYSVWGFSQWGNSCQHLTVPGIKPSYVWQLMFSPNSVTISWPSHSTQAASSNMAPSSSSLIHAPSMGWAGSWPSTWAASRGHSVIPVLITVLPLREAGCLCQSPLPTAPQFPSLPMHSHEARTRVQHAWNSTKVLYTFKDASTYPVVNIAWLMNSSHWPHDTQSQFPSTP